MCNLIFLAQVRDQWWVFCGLGNEPSGSVNESLLIGLIGPIGLLASQEGSEGFCSMEFVSSFLSPTFVLGKVVCIGPTAHLLITYDHMSSHVDSLRVFRLDSSGIIGEEV
jgi:hypothetical protein